MPSATRPKWSLIALVWLIPAAVALLQAVAGYLLRGTLREEWPWALMQIPPLAHVGALTPVVFYAAERFPFRRDRLARSTWTHFGIALLIAVVIEVLWLQISFLSRATSTPKHSPECRTTAPRCTRCGAEPPPGRRVHSMPRCSASLRTLGYHRQFRERELRAAQLEAQLALAQVQALKMQVHPHFLFNTLHAVTVLIREDPAGATRVVTRLGDLLQAHALPRDDRPSELPP
jgi:hypothetical protein